MKKFKTLVVVEDEKQIEVQFRFFESLIGQAIVKKRFSKYEGHIETDIHVIEIVIEKTSGRGHRCNHLIYLGENEQLKREIYKPIVRDYEQRF